jgi:hypothetical protein
MNSSTWFLEQLFVYVAVLLAYSWRVIGWALSSSRAAAGPRIELFLFQCLNEVFASSIIPRRPGRLMLSSAHIPLTGLRIPRWHIGFPAGFPNSLQCQQHAAGLRRANAPSGQRRLQGPRTRLQIFVRGVPVVLDVPSRT